MQRDPYLDPDDSWAGLLVATIFVARATYAYKSTTFSTGVWHRCHFECLKQMICTQKEKLNRRLIKERIQKGFS
jgi:hypothetical protein